MNKSEKIPTLLLFLNLELSKWRFFFFISKGERGSTRQTAHLDQEDGADLLPYGDDRHQVQVYHLVARALQILG